MFGYVHTALTSAIDDNSNFGRADISTTVSSYVSIHFIINTAMKHKTFNK